MRAIRLRNDALCRIVQNESDDSDDFMMDVRV